MQLKHQLTKNNNLSYRNTVSCCLP